MVDHESMTMQSDPAGARQAAFIEHLSAHAFAPTLLKLEQLIGDAGLSIFARIDHAEAARSVGLVMPPTTVLLYGHARGGTPIMLAAPQAALDLPLRVLVREDDDGHVLVGFHPIDMMLCGAGVADDLAVRLAPAQTILEGVRS